MAEKRKPPKKVAETTVKPSSGLKAAPPAADYPTPPAGLEKLRVPVQSEGFPQRPYLVGGPPRPGRIGIALQVLNDPVARSSFSRVYSGQTSRRWSR